MVEGGGCIQHVHLSVPLSILAIFLSRAYFLLKNKSVYCFFFYYCNYYYFFLFKSELIINLNIENYGDYLKWCYFRLDSTCLEGVVLSCVLIDSSPRFPFLAFMRVIT